MKQLTSTCTASSRLDNGSVLLVTTGEELVLVTAGVVLALMSFNSLLHFWFLLSVSPFDSFDFLDSEILN